MSYRTEQRLSKSCLRHALELTGTPETISQNLAQGHILDQPAPAMRLMPQKCRNCGGRCLT